MQMRHANLSVLVAVLTASGCGSNEGRFETACTSNSDCAETERCAKGSCGPSVGVCVERPTSCSSFAAFVCGCDGKTYLNRCTAELEGVLLQSTGGCPCADDGECMEGEYCNATDSCSGAGLCALGPETCDSEEVEPVCGCDGETYDNECFAAQARVRVSAEAACECSTNAGCTENQFCNATTCDGPGFCQVRPPSCSPGGDPVTACDDLRYENECSAYQAGLRLRPDN